jgi:hypothetical protein
VTAVKRYASARKRMGWLCGLAAERSPVSRWENADCFVDAGCARWREAEFELDAGE